jgi:hypothetical protein
LLHLLLLYKLLMALKIQFVCEVETKAFTSDLLIKGLSAMNLSTEVCHYTRGFHKVQCEAQFFVTLT